MKHILLALALPPTCFVVLIVIGLLMRGAWRRTGRRPIWTSMILLILLGMPVISDSLLLALTAACRGHPIPAHRPGDGRRNVAEHG